MPRPTFPHLQTWVTNSDTFLDPFGPGTPIWEKGDKIISALRAHHTSATGHIFGLRRMLAHRGLTKPQRDAYILSLRTIAKETPDYD